jgi:hypothetical protein
LSSSTMALSMPAPMNADKVFGRRDQYAFLHQTGRIRDPGHIQAAGFDLKASRSVRRKTMPVPAGAAGCAA